MAVGQVTAPVVLIQTALPRVLDLPAVLHANGYCGQVKRSRRHTWVCLRPTHGGNQPNTDAYRRRHGTTPNVDKHVFVTIDADRLPL